MSFIDCDQSIVFNGHTSAPPVAPAGGGPKVGTVIRSVGPWGIPVDMRTDKLPLQDGSTKSDAYLTGRRLPIHAEVYGNSPGDVQDRLDAFIAAYSPRSPLFLTSAPFTFSRPTANLTDFPSGTIPLYLTCAPSKHPWHPETAHKDTQSGAHVMDVYAELFAEDPYEYINESRQIITLGTSASALPYRGNAPSYFGVDVWIRLSGTPGPVITLRLAQSDAAQGIGYASISLNLASLSSATVYALSFKDRVVTASGTMTGVIGASSIFGAVTPGGTAWYSVVSGDGGKIDYVKILYPEGFF